MYKIVCYVQQRNKLKIKNVGNKLMNDKLRKTSVFFVAENLKLILNKIKISEAEDQAPWKFSLSNKHKSPFEMRQNS